MVVTDLFGGSPSNLSLMACHARNRSILYGANLPMLVKLAKSRKLPVADAVTLLCQQTPLRAIHLGRAVRRDNRIDGRIESDKVRAFLRRLTAR